MLPPRGRVGREETLLGRERVASESEPRMLKDGRPILLRHLEGRDVNGIWDNFGEVIDEGVALPIFSKVDNENERRAWYHDFLIQGQLCLIAEDPNVSSGKHVVGQCTIEHPEWDAAKHVGILGIIIRSDFRNVGLGAHLIAYAKRDRKSVV